MMNADIAQSMAFIIIGILMIIILLKILFIVHGQNRHVKDLELRMKAMEKADEATNTLTQPTEGDTK